MSIDLARINTELGRNAEGLVDWAIGLGQNAIVTTNFRPFEAVILHMVTRAKRDVPVVQACGLIFATVYIGMNLLADIAGVLSNPRLRHPK